MTQRWWMHFRLCPWGWRLGVAPATALHISSTWRGNPPFVIVALAVAIAIAIAVAISVTIANSVAIAVAAAHRRCHRPFAVAVTVDHCRRCLCCVAVSHCQHRCPCCWPLPSPLPSAIAVAISVGHHRRHCRWPFLRVVALARQEFYSTNWGKECLPYFILFGQWAVHWSKPDDWQGVERQWPTPALVGKRQAASG